MLLNAAALLSPADVQALAVGLCPAQPSRARLLLQEALDKQKNSTREPGGSVILVLDKVRSQCCHYLRGSAACCAALTFLLLLLLLLQHLQKLPWESMACLRDLPVTRLPSLRFLLSYTLTQRVRWGGTQICMGSVPPVLG